MSKPALTAKRLIVDQFREHYFALTHPWHKP